MAQINPYLNFPGNAEEAFNFYKSVFGGEFITLQRYKDAPGAEGVPAEGAEQIMHISLPIGKDSILMASDVPESMGQPFKLGNNFSLSVNADSEAEADGLFNGLAAEGKVDMPLQKTFWGAYFGMLTDQFGIKWMVNHDYRGEK